MRTLRITLIGGPTALIEFGGFRLLTDPTFDPPGEYRLPHVTLKKISYPAISAEELGPIDAVLLSHDQHSDNLDNAGRTFLTKAARVLTTVAGAKRLGGRTEGLVPWETIELAKPDGSSLRVTATPARHGPVGIEPLSGGCCRVCPHLPKSPSPPCLHHGRHSLVPWHRRSSASFPRGSRAAVRRCRPDARTFSSYHGHERCDRDRTRVS
jgi:hypothetical protein